jgi:predicted nucleic acid-binding protein
LPIETAVLDASVLVEFLRRGVPPLRWSTFVAPAHADAEVLSAFARLHRAGELSAAAVDDMLEGLSVFPLQRIALSSLLRGAFALRGALAMRDAPYVEIARGLGVTLLTLDQRLAATCRQQRLCEVFTPLGR